MAERALAYSGPPIGRSILRVCQGSNDMFHVSDDTRHVSVFINPFNGGKVLTEREAEGGPPNTLQKTLKNLK
jgi:hypothetical protein